MNYLRLTPLRHTQLNLTTAAMMITNQGYHSEPDVVFSPKLYLNKIKNKKQNEGLR